MSICISAKSIGNNDARSSDLAKAIRKDWLRASAEKKAEIVRDFKVGYISGREKVSLTRAGAIFDAGKGANAIDPKAIDRATSGFNYHIVGKTKPAAEPVKRMRLSRELREAAKDFLAMFDSVAQAKACLSAL